MRGQLGALRLEFIDHEVVSLVIINLLFVSFSVNELSHVHSYSWLRRFSVKSELRSRSASCSLENKVLAVASV